jgi:hypothetical protein
MRDHDPLLAELLTFDENRELFAAGLRAIREPGHDATAAVVAPMADRTEALRIWGGIIDEIVR